MTVVEESEDNVCMEDIVTPSSSIRPLVKDQIFWNVRDLSEMLLSVAANLNEPTYVLLAGKVPGLIVVELILSVPALVVILSD